MKYNIGDTVYTADGGILETWRITKRAEDDEGDEIYNADLIQGPFTDGEIEFYDKSDGVYTSKEDAKKAVEAEGGRLRIFGLLEDE